MVITIDGPAGVGKSTAARNLAAAMGVSYLDTGATYRAVTLRAMRADDDLTDEARLATHAREMDLHLIPADHALRVILDGQDVSEDIRLDAVSRNARHAACAPAVREVLVALQQKIGKELGSFVTEGRDQGTVVFPDADVKFFFAADPAVRARRRCAELEARGESADFDDMLQAILARDASDTGRSVGPLRKADGAIVVDTTDFTEAETLAELLRHVEAR